MEPKFCPLCRSELRARAFDGTVRAACSATDCSFVHWNNPVPVVAGLVRLGERYVLARGARWPAGLFSLLTGFVERGESPAAAIAREVREELGLATQELDFIGHFPLGELNQLLMAYTVHAEGAPVLGVEIAAIEIVSAAELACFDFGPLELTRSIVAQWLERRRAAP